MIIDKIAVISVAVIITICLAVLFVKKQVAGNLVIISLLSFSIGIYISFTLYKIDMPLYIHIPVLVISIFIPFIVILLQYNNINISSKILYRNAKKLYNKGKYDLAIKELMKLMEADKKKSEYLFLLGKCYEKQNEYVNARDCFALAIDLNKEDYNAYYELGKVLDKTDKKDSAVVMFDKAIKLCPDMYEAYEALGICLTDQKKYKEAISVYKEAIKYHNESYEVYYNIAVLEMQTENYDDAEKDFEMAISLNDNLFEAHYNLANIKYLKGSYDSAIEEYKKVLSNALYSEKAYYKIAMIYAIKKEYDKAMAVIEYLIETNSNYIDNIKEEFIFSPMKDKIDEYLFSRVKIIQENEDYLKKGKKSKNKPKNKKDKNEDTDKLSILNSKLIGQPHKKT